MRHNQMTGIGKITMNKAKLIEILAENRTKHRDIFEKALVKYRERAIARLDGLIAEVKAGKAPSLWVNDVPVPEEHTRDYDRVIQMMELHQGDTIELSEESYVKLVDDQWEWSQSFWSNSGAYIGMPHDPE